MARASETQTKFEQGNEAIEDLEQSGLGDLDSPELSSIRVAPATEAQPSLDEILAKYETDPNFVVPPDGPEDFVRHYINENNEWIKVEKGIETNETERIRATGDMQRVAEHEQRIESLLTNKYIVEDKTSGVDIAAYDKEVQVEVVNGTRWVSVMVLGPGNEITFKSYEYQPQAEVTEADSLESQGELFATEHVSDDYDDELETGFSFFASLEVTVAQDLNEVNSLEQNILNLNNPSTSSEFSFSSVLGVASKPEITPEPVLQTEVQAIEVFGIKIETLQPVQENLVEVSAGSLVEDLFKTPAITNNTTELQTAKPEIKSVGVGEAEQFGLESVDLDSESSQEYELDESQARVQNQVEILAVSETEQVAEQEQILVNQDQEVLEFVDLPSKTEVEVSRQETMVSSESVEQSVPNLVVVATEKLNILSVDSEAQTVKISKIDLFVQQPEVVKAQEQKLEQITLEQQTGITVYLEDEISLPEPVFVEPVVNFVVEPSSSELVTEPVQVFENKNNVVILDPEQLVEKLPEKPVEQPTEQVLEVQQFSEAQALEPEASILEMKPVGVGEVLDLGIQISDEQTTEIVSLESEPEQQSEQLLELPEKQPERSELIVVKKSVAPSKAIKPVVKTEKKPSLGLVEIVAETQSFEVQKSEARVEKPVLGISIQEPKVESQVKPAEVKEVNSVSNTREVLQTQSNRVELEAQQPVTQKVSRAESSREQLQPVNTNISKQEKPAENLVPEQVTGIKLEIKPDELLEDRSNSQATARTRERDNIVKTFSPQAEVITFPGSFRTGYVSKQSDLDEKNSDVKSLNNDSGFGIKIAA